MRLFIWLAILPSALLAWRVLSYDKVEKEPPKLLIRLFIFGMLTCIPAALLEALGEGVISAIAPSDFWVSALMYLIVVPLSEEGMKYLALRTAHNNPAFNYTFDAIVYAVMVGLGFATLENVLYVLESMSLFVTVMRGVLSVPMHCTCAVFMGYFYGVARGQEARGQESEARQARTLALTVPWLIHGLYDFSLDMDSWVALVLGLLMTVAVFFIASRQVRLASLTDEPIMASVTREVLIPTMPTSTSTTGEPLRGDWKSKGTPPPPFNG